MGVSCILFCLVDGVLQGHKVTVVILRRPRRFFEADRRHGAPVATRSEIRDVDLGARPPHGERGDVRVAPPDRRGANRPPRPRRSRRLDQIRRRVLGVLRSVGAGWARGGRAGDLRRRRAGRGLAQERRRVGRLLGGEGSSRLGEQRKVAPVGRVGAVDLSDAGRRAEGDDSRRRAVVSSPELSPASSRRPFAASLLSPRLTCGNSVLVPFVAFDIVALAPRG